MVAVGEPADIDMGDLKGTWSRAAQATSLTDQCFHFQFTEADIGQIWMDLVINGD